MGYAISGEPTLAAYYERLQPFATAFMALFGRTQLPHRSTLSRFLAALDQASVEALRGVFVQDALEHAGPAEGVGGLWDRQGQRWVVFDLDGTRQAARQRALPQGPDLPPPQRQRASGLCPWLYGAQAWGSGSHADDALTGPYPSVVGRVWQRGQCGLPRGVAARAGGDHSLSGQAGPTPRSSPHPYLWPIRQWSHRRGSAGGRDPLADARQRLRTA
jgi:hypothetical protein